MCGSVLVRVSTCVCVSACVRVSVCVCVHHTHCTLEYLHSNCKPVWIVFTFSLLVYPNNIICTFNVFYLTHCTALLERNAINKMYKFGVVDRICPLVLIMVIVNGCYIILCL